MSRLLKITLVIVLFVVAGLLLFSANNGDTGDQNTSPTSTQSAVNVPDGWETYKNAQFDFSIAHPPEVSVQAEGPNQNHIKFTYLGPNQATGEITDGYTLTVSSYEKNNRTLEEFAQQRFQEDLQASEEVKPVTSTVFMDRSAYTYTVENIGTVEHIVVENDDAYMVISSSISDPNNQGYRNEVRRMKNSLKLQEISGDEVTQPATSEIKLALLNSDVPEGEEPDRGCDKVAMITRDIEKTEAPLTAAMNELFSLDREEVQGFQHFIARTNDTLSFNRAEVTNGTANIYLEGELSGLAGVCDNPRAKIQIEETALQFPTVEDVQIYLNGEPTDLQPSGR